MLIALFKVTCTIAYFVRIMSFFYIYSVSGVYECVYQHNTVYDEKQHHTVETVHVLDRSHSCLSTDTSITAT